MNVVQIVGLHRHGDSDILHRAKNIWKHVIYADWYLSIMLGMYHGISNAALNLEQHPQTNTLDPSSTESLCRIAGSIIERNQSSIAATPAMARMTQIIDFELGQLLLQIPRLSGIHCRGNSYDQFALTK